ncbi:hypothetical protein RV040_000807 [Vibrio alginolyticus]|uniref:hypothetical protein n=1 Tax=Vibrio parahaemolyticus TaxID=670 RepID=UPI0007A06D70|nr:hypothetical protein [Vibrio parahaemolyticus]ELK8497340.1 hypothetical protein [Vibrio alginolyticus]EHR6175858.1 hypothetical protein [Vibrio parahaemolyticus]ELP2655149.1 hypothetical protein [Vibrio parahaemolyticus]KYX34905.1 hypothetical protein AU388_14990 [Vibrio parahaemolyticus]OCP72546.1 hypothetical protein AKH08_05710 [Vibrio parahaemolyticus]
MAIEEACSTAAVWIEPKFIIPAFMVLLSSGLFPFLLHKYKVKREREEKLFDTRREEYQGYFKKMEEAARLAGQDYDKYLTETLPNASRKLYESNSSPEAMVEYQQTLNDFTKNINEGFQKATNELISLRIVCSKELALLLDEFEGTYQQMMSLQPQMLEEIRASMTMDSFITGQFNFDTPSKVKMTNLGVSIVNTRNQIILTMRRELGFEY